MQTMNRWLRTKADQPRTEIVTICGKHCESGDAVVLDRPLQRPDLDDVICVFSTGAYCHSMASNYNGQPRPGIVFVKDGQATLVTRRETMPTSWRATWIKRQSAARQSKTLSYRAARDLAARCVFK